MSDDPPKPKPKLKPKRERAGTGAKDRPNVGDKPAKPAGERTVLGVGEPLRERTVPGVGIDPNMPPMRPRQQTLSGVAEEASPAHVRLALGSATSDPTFGTAATLHGSTGEPVSTRGPGPKSAPISSPTPISSPAPISWPAPASAPPPMSAGAPMSSPPPMSSPGPKSSPTSVRLPVRRPIRPPTHAPQPHTPPPPGTPTGKKPDVPIQPAAAPRPGILGKLFAIVFVGTVVVSYLKRDVIMDKISPPAPLPTMTAAPSPFVMPPALPTTGRGAASNGGVDVFAVVPPKGPAESAGGDGPGTDLDAGASKDAATFKDGSAPKHPGAKSGGARDAGAPKGAGGAKIAPTTKPPPKPAPPH